MRSMRVAIRVDLSVTIGLGHAQRCRSLAFALRAGGASVLFVSRPIDLDSAKLLDCANDELRLLNSASSSAELFQEAPRHAAWAGVHWEQDAAETVERVRDWRPDWLIVDHYSFDVRWHEAVRKGLGCRILVIDDLADRQLDADILVDHNWSENHRSKYGAYAAHVESMLVGPRYALLGPDYVSANPYSYRAEVRSIGIFMGGTDAGSLSEMALDACRDVAGFTGSIEIATTSFNSNLLRLRARCAASPATELVIDQASLAGFFSRHDLQIGAGGGATWERCCMGAPTVAVIAAENQVPVLRPLHGLGVLIAIENLGASILADTVSRLIDDSEVRRTLAAAARGLIDGMGATRVANEILKRC